MHERLTRYAVVDLEATGPNIDEGDKIIQIGAVIIENNEIIAEYSMLINPETPIPLSIQQLTGIKMSDIEHAPSIEQVIGLWYERLKDCYFIGHQLAFDLRMMKRVFELHGYDFDPPAFDTYLLSQLLIPNAQGYGVSDLARHFNVQFDHAHDALADAKMTAWLLNRLADVMDALSVDTQQLLEQGSQYLPHQEAIFLENHSRFRNDIVVDTILTENKELNAMHTSLSVDYCLEQWDKYPRLLVENSQFPISKNTIHQIALKNGQQTPTLLLVSTYREMHRIIEANTDETISISGLKDKNCYLNLEMWHRLIQVINISELNQAETIAYLALHVCVEKRFFDLTRINRGLQVLRFLNQWAKQFQIFEEQHQVYNKVKSKALQSDVLIITYAQLFREENNVLLFDSSRNKHVLFSDARELFNAYMRHYTVQLPIASWLVQLQSIYEQAVYQQSFLDQDYLYNLKRLIETMDQWISQMTKEISIESEDNGFWQSHADDPSGIVVETIKKLMTFSQQLLTDTTDKKLSTLLKQMIDLFKHFLNQDKSYFLSFKGEILNGNLYHFTLTQHPHIINSEWWNSLSKDIAYLIFCSGSFNFDSAIGWFQAIGRPSGKHLTMESLTNDEVILTVPANYLTTGELANNSLAAVNGLCQYIEDESSHHYLVIATNLKKCQDYYYGLQDFEAIASQFLIQAKGHHGSVKRMLSRVQDSKKSILILTLGDLSALNQENLPENLIVMIDKLPFLSPEHPRLKAISSINQQEAFDLLSLPLMMERLKRIIWQLGFNPTYILWDERIFTKSYANVVQKQLKPVIQFEFSS